MRPSFPALLGVAIGDAVGFGVEFVGRNYLIDHGYDLRKDWIDLRATFSNGVLKEAVPGQYSDDTEHTIGVVKALISGRPFNEDLLLEYWKAEYESWQGKKDLDRGHGSIRHWYHGTKELEEIRALQRKKEDPGNAPTMRAVPFGFLPPHLIEPYSWINTNTTHPHPRGAAASILVAQATRMVLTDQDLSQVFPVLAPTLKNFPDYGAELLQADEIGPPETLTQAQMDFLFGDQQSPFFFMKPDNSYHGLSVKAFKTALTALYVLKHAENPWHGLETAIHLGGDVDSLASVVTGILCLRDGLDTIPDFVVEEVEGRAEIEKLATQFDHWRKYQFSY